MNAIIRWGGGLVAALLFTSVSFGQTWVTPVYKMPYPPNPDACGPGFYVMNGCGAVYGPNYWLVPPYAPFNGMLPGKTGQCLQQAQAGIAPWTIPTPPAQYPNPGKTQVGIYPSHTYIRSPRDFFMWGDDMLDQRGRDVRPARVTP
jgi:hypothetical protein